MNSTLLNTLVKRESDHQLNLEKELQQAKDYYAHLRTLSDAVDKTLSNTSSRSKNNP
jgi:hypothetical protein